MSFEARWTDQAVRDLQNQDPKVADRILRKVEWFCAQNHPLAFAKPLDGSLKDVYRFRIGDYRVLFEIIDDKPHILMVLRVRHRRDVYTKH